MNTNIVSRFLQEKIPFITLVSEDPEMIAAWTRLCRPDLPVHVYRGEWADCASWSDQKGSHLLMYPTNSVLSIEMMEPKKSFVPKDVLDAQFVGYFGRAMFRAAQERMYRHRHRPLMVGEVMLVETTVRPFPYVLFVPVIDPSLPYDPLFGYRATLAALQFWKYGTSKGVRVRRFVKAIVMPEIRHHGVDLTPQLCAHLQFAALADFFVGNTNDPTNISELIAERQRILREPSISHGRHLFDDEHH